ncbi:hypothetical protein BC628DRAFT_1384167 [Trametes gibbosa]|nr:hypothetical protein BC628DRAFT_1384167 [Trametes gibbosa]UVI59154.1 Zn(2)-Cys(6)56 [Trametes gibbosa]
MPASVLVLGPSAGIRNCLVIVDILISNFLIVDTRLYKDTMLPAPEPALCMPAHTRILLHMSDFEFVIEVPQSAHQTKKRPRLVTSCDHCRIKKIKCVQQSSAGKCEACAAARLPCLFRDREQYFAERTRILSGVTSTVCEASTSDLNKAQLSAINASSNYASSSNVSPSATVEHSHEDSHYSHVDMNGGDLDQFQAFAGGMGAQAVLPLSWYDSLQTSTWPQHGANQLSGIPTTATPPLAGSPGPSPSSTSGLFDPRDPTQPHPNLMMEFVPVFFEKFGAAYPFLNSSSVCDQFFQRRLSPLLANSIAASAARFSTIPEIQQIGPANTANVYCQMANNLILQNSSGASLDVVHGLIILAWVEYKRGRHVAFLTCVQTATHIATELGISDDAIRSSQTQVLDPEVARVLHATFQSIGQLHRTISASPLVNASPVAPVHTSSSCALWGSPDPRC